MSPDKDAELARRYPQLYLNAEGTECGFECGDGWFDIIDRLSAQLTTLVEKQPPAEREAFHIVYVKEKFGYLRVNMNRLTTSMSTVIFAAENESRTVCEDCGAPGQSRSGGWIRTLCDTHAVDHEKRRSRQ